MNTTEAKFVISSPDVQDCPQWSGAEYAFIGRSNVGKSSLINMLTRTPGLAKTSQKPGKTLLINHFDLNYNDSQGKHQTIRIVDLPGYGFAQTGQKQREQLRRMIERYCLMRESLTSLFVLLDSRLAPQKIDLEFISWLGENEIPFALVFTKIDKMGKGALSANMLAYRDTLLEQWEELPPIFLTSSEKGTGRDELLDYIEEVTSSL